MIINDKEIQQASMNSHVINYIDAIFFMTMMTIPFWSQTVIMRTGLLKTKKGR